MNDDRIRADEPVHGTPHEPQAPGEGVPHGVAAAAARANEIDEDTAGDGVAFFEGGDGREEAKGDIERNG